MKSLFLVLAFAAAVTYAQDVAEDNFDFAGPAIGSFRCPEETGLFPDPEQCDLYYECVKGKSFPKLCPDGEVFDDSVPNRERCTLPYNVDCGDRVFVQEPRTDVDPGCKRANGFFPHIDENVCDKFYQCNDGHRHELNCAPPLVFDEGIGSCAHQDQVSADARKCNDNKQLKVVDGFQCEGPNVKVLGPLGLVQEHPTYPHPSDCQFFFTCFHGKDPIKLGCAKGQVFDAVSLTCKAPEDVPECGCWYECGENSRCPDSCNADCSCPSDAPAPSA